MRTRLRRLVVTAVALFTAASALHAAAAQPPGRQEHPSHGGLSAVIRYTEYGIPHILATADRSPELIKDGVTKPPTSATSSPPTA